MPSAGIITEEQSSPLKKSCESAAADVSDALFVRVPVMDRQKRVDGYKITCHSNDPSWTGDCGGVTGRRTILGLHQMGGFERFANGQKIHLLADPECMIGSVYEVMPAESTVLILPANGLIAGNVREACHKAKDQGYGLSILVDSQDEMQGEWRDIAQSIRVSIKHAITTSGQRVIRNLSANGYRLTALDVDSYDEFKMACDAGFNRFQGTFFCRPEEITCRALSANQSVCLRLLSKLSAEALDWQEIERLIKSDVALSYGLLRYLNSAALGVRNKITSINQAMLLLGEIQLRKWASLASIGAISDGKPLQLLVNSLIRARFCEELAMPFGVPDQHNEMYLVGLLSMIDAVLDRPMKHIIQSMSLGERVAGVLLGEQDSAISTSLRLAVACENGGWATAGALCGSMGVSTKDIAMKYYQSIQTVDRLLAA